MLRARGHPSAVPGELSLRLPFRAPLCPDNLFGHLAATGVPGVEEWREGPTGAPCACGTGTASSRCDHSPATSAANSS
ncbi:hypothetical protein ACFQX6_56955 [Streptosporangium lutulentum]